MAFEAVSPVVKQGKRYELGKLPSDFFEIPPADPSIPGSPRPVKIGQTLAVEVFEALPGRPITGERVVRDDGTISLGFYGDLLVVDLNRDQIKIKVIERLRGFLNDDILGLISYKTNRVAAVRPLNSDRIFVDYSGPHCLDHSTSFSRYGSDLLAS